MASFSSSNSCEVPPPFLRLPLIISESLRAAVTFDGSSTQGIVSILLSGADLAKLDLSQLQLFSVDGLAMKTAASMANYEVASRQAELNTFREEDFSFQTPFILSPVSDLPPGALAFPVLKSKGVVEAEKATAEHHLLKLGAVSPSPRARKKAVSMDEISLNEQLSSLDVAVVEKGAEETADMAGARVRGRGHLPALELAPLPCPGLEQRAETLKKKHFERMLSRTLSDVRSEEAKIDLKASPAAKFLLQVMPWELTPPVTPVTTPAAIPFIWEDVPGRPKPRTLPSPCPSLPLPPRLLPAPPPFSSSSSSSSAVTGPLSDFMESSSPNGDAKHSSPLVKSNPHHGRTHRKNTHSWHVLHHLFSNGHQRCPSHAIDGSLEANRGSENAPACEPKDLSVAGGDSSQDGGSSTSTSINSNSTSLDFSPSTPTVNEDALDPCETRLSARYGIPPLYVAPIVPLTPPHRDLGPLGDDCLKRTNKLNYLAKLFRQGKGRRKSVSRTGSFFNLFNNKHGNVTSESNSYLLDDAKGGQTTSRIAYDVHTDDHCRNSHTAATRKSKSVSGQMSPLASSLIRSPKPAKPRNHLGSRSTKVFFKLRRRGVKVIVASYRAIKRALFLRRAGHSKLFNHTQLPYHTLHR